MGFDGAFEKDQVGRQTAAGDFFEQAAVGQRVEADGRLAPMADPERLAALSQTHAVRPGSNLKRAHANTAAQVDDRDRVIEQVGREQESLVGREQNVADEIVVRKRTFDGGIFGSALQAPGSVVVDQDGAAGAAGDEQALALGVKREAQPGAGGGRLGDDGSGIEIDDADGWRQKARVEYECVLAVRVEGEGHRQGAELDLAAGRSDGPAVGEDGCAVGAAARKHLR